MRELLENRAEEAKDDFSLDCLQNIVGGEIRTNIKNSDAKTSMKNLFFSYRKILWRLGLCWIVRDNQKVSVLHVLLNICPQTLKDCRQSDLAFLRDEEP